jgi:hypothetical protein
LSAPGSLQGFATIPRAVLHDSTLPSHAKMVYLVLSSHVGGKETVWPSHKTIAEIAGISVTQVKRMLQLLRGAGLVDWIERKPEKRVQLSNEYWLLAGSNPAPEKVVVPPGPRPTRTPSHQDPVPPEGGRGPGRATERESLNKPTTGSIKRLPTNINALFDRFWAAYPRKVEKAKAMKLFADKVRKDVDPEVIIAGAERYRRDPNREDEFTKHPTTWLNGGCWDDEPLPPRSNGRGAPPPPRRPQQGLTVPLPLASGQR